MSLLDYAMKRFGSSGNTSATCPVCGSKSSHPASKIRQGQTLLCPKCKSMFVVPR
ncbi:transposase [Enterobacteriaceae bacterium H11S18]|uniref:YnfU family zinc-binding protein n=1 Tax=Enterobacteriaceae TaxID=543 RepID=UPI0019265293|nr:MULTISPECIES: YnfU family zinc-binding protein [Enterobacteriaceae]MCT4706560.1 transposase [Dryocola clanedunensis]MCT4713372.1 transposase [Dryocola clanedunensis]